MREASSMTAFSPGDIPAMVIEMVEFTKVTSASAPIEIRPFTTVTVEFSMETLPSIPEPSSMVTTPVWTVASFRTEPCFMVRKNCGRKE